MELLRHLKNPNLKISVPCPLDCCKEGTLGLDLLHLPSSPSPFEIAMTYNGSSSLPESSRDSSVVTCSPLLHTTSSDDLNTHHHSKVKGGGGCLHHRPRIKLKDSSSRPLDDFQGSPQTSRLADANKCPQLLRMIHVPFSVTFLVSLALLTFGLDSALVQNIQGACATSTSSTNVSFPGASDLLLHSQLNQLVKELNEEESTLLQQDLLEESQEKGGGHLISPHSQSVVSLSPTANYDDNYETARDYFLTKGNSIDDDSGKTDLKEGTPTITPSAGQLKEGRVTSSATQYDYGHTPPVQVETPTTPTSTSNPDLPNLRPVAHFSSAESTHQPGQDAHLQRSPTTFIHLMQGDSPRSSSSFSDPKKSDNNGGDGDGGKNAPPPSASLHSGLQDVIAPAPSQKVSGGGHNKPIKSHKSLPQPLNPGANDPHELSHLHSSPHHSQVIVLGGKSLSLDHHHLVTTPPPSHKYNVSSYSFIGLTTAPTASPKGGLLYTNGKPRRLESLSHGLTKNRIPNSINFEDEPLESSAYNSVGLGGDSSSLKDGGEGGGGGSLLSSGKLRRNSSTSLPNTMTPVMRRSPLQIRRDLSRLVAAAKDGTGNGIDDDIGSLPSKCDRLFISTENGPRNGSFESPSLALESGHLYQCIFMFVARPNERVEITFHGFKVRGTPPECVHEWVDIWTEVEGTDPTDLITTPFSGRYCGKIPPRKRISLYGGIAVGFYSDRNFTDESIFHGSYSFINETRYIVGTPLPRTQCSYTILGTSNKGVGELLSPTYPGVYPKKLSCTYKFVGTVGQRIRIEFRDFDVFFGGAHCPFDDVKIYDGPDPTSPLIGTYCGQQRNLVVYSSEHMMLVTFTTLDRNTDSQNRGFNAVYEFSNGFVKLDFIEKNKGGHIRGTECDQRILSMGQSDGFIYSPNYPFLYLPKIVCRYFVYGLQDPQNLEQVRLSFDIFDVPSSTTSAEDENNQSDAKRCGDAFLKVYLKGQEVIQAYDKADHEFCGKEIPETVASDGPRLVLVFSSGETQGSGFKAKYWFRTDYRIPGTQSPDGCHFSYNSQSRAKGEFNSPRFPSNYPTQTNCTYIFQQRPNEQVRIVFDNFKLRADKFNYTDRGAYGTSCEEDWVEIWNVMSSQDDRLVGRYCGTTAPGPIESKERATSLKVIMSTDEDGVYSGFKARYTYFTADSPFGNCGRNITQSLTGILTSPKWPGKYDGPSKLDGSAACNWYLNVRQGSRVMLYFQHFSIEGEPAGRGCPAAAVRIWEDPEGVPIELCGEALLNENRQYVSLRNYMRVTFITADKAVGAPGFQAIWTEVQDGASGVPCHPGWFRCSKTEFCIPSDLACDGNHNCGFHQGEEDRSDELLCGLDIGDMNFIFSIGVGVAVTLLVIIILCAWGQRRRRRRRRRLQLRRPPIHVCDNAGARFAAMDSV